MKYIIAGAIALTALFAWIGGMVLAHGFWSTTFAIIMPLWAWYLFVEKVMQVFGLIA